MILDITRIAWDARPKEEIISWHGPTTFWACVGPHGDNFYYGRKTLVLMASPHTIHTGSVCEDCLGMSHADFWARLRKEGLVE